ncbi:hypothetical protein [Actinoplanes sp. NPDC049265]|uniref:hypothetical protein n=1 Tax=Actinoplanes sp. NPDC049265 TaxID=3363902 RepID=UPI003717F2B2
MPRKLLPKPRPALAHRVDGSSDVYRLTSIGVPEVTTGTVAVEVRCGAVRCAQPVSCVIDSPRNRVRRLRRRDVSGGFRDCNAEPLIDGPL